MTRIGKSGLTVLFLIASGASLWFLAQVPRENFPLTFLLFFIAFGSMLGMYQLSTEKLQVNQILFMGLVLRACVFFFEPNWSEDGVRFLWDGTLVKEGKNPYLLTPEEWSKLPRDNENPFWEQSFKKLNSSTYYSVYPPLKQVLFWLGALFAQNDLHQGYLVLRGLLLGLEAGVFYLLWTLLVRFQRSEKLIFFYWFNPLVIVEIIGNLHFEGGVLFFLLLACWGFDREKKALSGLAWGLAVGIKLLPLLLAPSLLFWKETKKNPAFWGSAFLTLMLSFSPLIFYESWKNFFQSLQLFQGKFEFNASLYYLARTIGFWWQGYNTIEVLTKIGFGITFLGAIWISWKRSSSSIQGFLEGWVLLYLGYFLVQPVVHPWYLLPALGISILSGKWTFILWSFGAIFSYQAYSYFPVQEKTIFLILEYGLVGLGLYVDYFRKQRTFTLVQ